MCKVSSGVTARAYDGAGLGVGGIALPMINKSSEGTFVHGSRSQDNEWHLVGMQQIICVSYSFRTIRS
jgi:hypothetical protein